MTATERAGERADLLETFAKHRWLLRHTVDGLTDEQAALTPTASELCLGGLIKHVAITEAQWVDFILKGTQATEPSGGEVDYTSASWRHAKTSREKASTTGSAWRLSEPVS